MKLGFIPLTQILNKQKIKSKNSLGKFTKNFEKKINEIKSNNLRNSLSQLLDVIKND